MLLHIYSLDVFLQNVNLIFSTWVGNFDWKIIEHVPFSRVLIDRKCLEMLLVLTYLDIQTYTSSSLHVSFFHQGVNLRNWRKLLVAKSHEFRSLLWNWNLDCWKSGKSAFTWDKSWYSDSTSLKITALNSSISVWFDAVILLNDS